MKLTESKSNLARLMSEESIQVEQRSNVQTAFFDTEARLLVVPEFKEDVSKNVIDLLLGHEVGHALATPPLQWRYAIDELKINKGILNLVEDFRIETLIKNKYPGLRKAFHFGYTELYNNDFFGTSTLDFDTMNLADKINLQCKIGFIQDISFNEKESAFLKAVESVITFDDVIKVAQELQEYLKEQLKEEYNDYVKTLSYEYSDNGIEMDSDEFDNSLPMDSFVDDNGPVSFEEYLEDELKSHTQEAAERNQRELYKDDGNETVYVDVPEIDLNNHVIDFKTIFNGLSNYAQYIDNTAYNKFKAENAPLVSYLIKEFNLKKNAKGRKKTKIAKTGDINLNKLYNYKLADDIFKRATIVPNEQSHGLVFFLDWSGSMTKYIEETVKQLIVLLMFCRKAHIPYEVYAFTSNYVNGKFVTPKYHELSMYPVSLMNLFSSRMSNTQFITACNYLLSFDGREFKRPNRSLGIVAPHWFQLGNTPLNHAIILSGKLMQEFKDKTKVQIANAIYLTDGESQGLGYNSNLQYTYITEINSYGSNVFLRDRKSNEVMRFKFSSNVFKETDQIVEFMKKIYNFRLFSFRLIEQRELKKAFYMFNSGTSMLNVQEFSKNNCVEAKTNFDKFYFVKTNNKYAVTELGNLEGKSTANIAKDFSKVMSNKVNTKVFLTKFISFIGG